MQKVDFFSAVTFGPFVKSFPQILLEIADNYFGGKRVQVLPGFAQGKSEGVFDCNTQSSYRTTVITRLLYAASVLPLIPLAANKTSLKTSVLLSLAVPTLMLSGKGLLRWMYQFHRIEFDKNQADVAFSPVTFLAQPPKTLKTVNDAPKHLLEVGTRYQLSYAAMAELRIIPDAALRNHNLPQRSNRVYSIPPCINRGVSELPDYKDSYFEFEYMARYNKKTDQMDNTYYEVVRRKTYEPLSEGTHFLTVDKVVDLAIIPIVKGQGFSVRSEYKDAFFTCDDTLSGYNVNIRPFNRNYKFLPFNEAVELSDEKDIRALSLFKSRSDHRELPDGWHAMESNINEYSNSVILVKEENDKCTCVRMLKPKNE